MSEERRQLSMEPPGSSVSREAEERKWGLFGGLY